MVFNVYYVFIFREWWYEFRNLECGILYKWMVFFKINSIKGEKVMGYIINFNMILFNKNGIVLKFIYCICKNKYKFY